MIVKLNNSGAYDVYVQSVEVDAITEQEVTVNKIVYSGLSKDNVEYHLGVAMEKANEWQSILNQINTLEE